MHTESKPAMGFAQTGLSPAILSILERQGLDTPTPIQAQAIPIALKGGDIIGIAQTGTGKTLAFTLPLIEALLKGDGIGMVIAPTRELALQVEESIRRVTSSMQPVIRTVCLIGGMPMFRQIQDLKRGPRIIIATPGRLLDHVDRRTLRLEKVQVLILDEADRMLDMGFAPQIEQLMETMPENRQTMMFSATMAPEVTRLVTGYTRNATRIEVAKAGSNNDLVRQELVYVGPNRKTEVLQALLTEHQGPVLVFTRTKSGAGDLKQQISQMGHPAAEIHSDRSLRERRQALDGFKSGYFRVLVATDIAARGIDVANITLVVNYDLPDATDDYVHRIGRTGRAGNTGLAISFATHGQVRTVKEIERLVNTTLVLSPHSEQARERSSSGFRSNSFGGGSGSRRPSFGGGRSSQGGSSWSSQGGSRRPAASSRNTGAWTKNR